MTTRYDNSQSAVEKTYLERDLYRFLATPMRPHSTAREFGTLPDSSVIPIQTGPLRAALAGRGPAAVSAAYPGGAAHSQPDHIILSSEEAPVRETRSRLTTPPDKSDASDILRYAPPMPLRKDFALGILGSGFIVNECHLVSYRRAGFNPVAIASRSYNHAKSVATNHAIAKVYETYDALLSDPAIQVLDIAVPPAHQCSLIREACRKGTVKAILAQKPLALTYADANEAVRLCEDAGILLSVNQNMRFDPSVYAAKKLLDSGRLGFPVFVTIDMRAIPHWQPWQELQGSATLRVMSIHHLDCMRFWFGDPKTIFCSTRPDPRTAFQHTDGICTTILEYESGLQCVLIEDVWTGPAREGAPSDLGITWRIEGTDGLAIGDLGWCKTPYTTPSTMRFASKGDPAFRHFEPAESWFPDAFSATMGQLLLALETNTAPDISGRDNLRTMLLVEAAVKSASEHRVISLQEFAKEIGQ